VRVFGQRRMKARDIGAGDFGQRFLAEGGDQRFVEQPHVLRAGAGF